MLLFRLLTHHCKKTALFHPAWLLLPSALAAADKAPPPVLEDWTKPVPGHVAPAPGEHPRLFFRGADLPQLRERAATPEGKAIVKRLRVLLDGPEGTSWPKTPAAVDKDKGKDEDKGKDKDDEDESSDIA